MSIPVPAALTAPLSADALDDSVVANRAALVAVTTLANTLEADAVALRARVTTLEASGPAPAPTPTPVATVAITAQQETALAAVAVGSVAILRGPLVDIVLVRQ